MASTGPISIPTCGACQRFPYALRTWPHVSCVVPAFFLRVGRPYCAPLVLRCSTHPPIRQTDPLKRRSAIVACAQSCKKKQSNKSTVLPNSVSCEAVDDRTSRTRGHSLSAVHRASQMVVLICLETREMNSSHTVLGHMTAIS